MDGANHMKTWNPASIYCRLKVQSYNLNVAEILWIGQVFIPSINCHIEI